MVRRSPPRLLAVAAALLAVSACDESSVILSSGTPSSLEVTAYVDADGDGSFGAGDQALEGLTVTAAGAQSASATTGADGVATIAGLQPGSYSVSISGSIPDGAVLSTAPNVTVTAPFQGADLSADFRYAFEPGQLAGRLYRDDNGNGSYDAASDLAIGGFGVSAVRQSDQAEFDAVTDESGAFDFGQVRPGAYTITFNVPSTVDIPGGAVIDIVVGAAGTAALNVEFEGNPFTDIADARAAAPGTEVFVEAVVAWAPEFDDRVLFIQDGTAGIETFDSDLEDFAPSGGFEVGQRIRVAAEVGIRFDVIRLQNFSSVQLLGTGPEPAPSEVDAASINALENQGELVRIVGTVNSVENPSFGNQYVTLTDGAGGTFAVYSDDRTGIEIPDWTVGERYRVTGVLGYDNRDALPARVEPRFPTDLLLADNADIPIADARALPAETVVAVTGTVSRALGWTDRQAFLQDASGGVTLFTFDGLPDLAPGDQVEVIGEVGGFRGEVQIGPDNVRIISTDGPAPAPLAVTGAEVNAGLFQGELVTYSGTVTAAEAANSFGSAELGVTDADGTTITVFVDNRSGLDIDDFSVGQELIIVGVPGFFDGNDPGAQLEVIVDTDVTFVN